MAAFIHGTVTNLALDADDSVVISGDARLQITISGRPTYETSNVGTLTYGPYQIATTIVINATGDGTYTLPVTAPASYGVVYDPVAASMSAGGMRLPFVSPYLGQSSTRCLVPNNGNSGIFGLDSGMIFVARGGGLVNPVMEFPNWYQNSGVQAAFGTGTLEAAIEYPIGATPIRANECVAAGNGPVAMPAGNTTLTFNITIPDGAVFRVRSHIINPTGMIWTQTNGGSASAFGVVDGSIVAGGEWCDLGNAATTNRVVAAAPSELFQGSIYGPLVIASQTTRPSVLIVGDSRECGGGEGIQDLSFDVGITGRVVGKSMGYSSCAQASTLLATWNSGSHTYLNQLIAKGYWTHVINHYCINDINADSAYTTTVARRALFAANVKAILPTIKVIGCTLYPYQSSSDLFITKSGQVLSAQQQKLNPFNIAVRAGIAGEDFVWDVADGIDPFREGKYNVGPDPSATSRTPAIATASLSGTTLTVTATSQGALAVGDQIVDASGGTVTGSIASGTIITAIGTYNGTSGTLTVNKNHNNVNGRPNVVASTTVTNACWDSRDGLHAQWKGVEKILRVKGPDLLSMIRL